MVQPGWFYPGGDSSARGGDCRCRLAPDRRRARICVYELRGRKQFGCIGKPVPRPTSELELRIVYCRPSFAVDSQGASRAREMEALSRLLSEATLLLRTSCTSARRGWYGRWVMRLCRARYGYMKVIAVARAMKLICSLDLSKFHGSRFGTHVSLVTSSRLCFVAITRSMCQNVRLRPRVLFICLFN